MSMTQSNNEWMAQPQPVAAPRSTGYSMCADRLSNGAVVVYPAHTGRSATRTATPTTQQAEMTAQIEAAQQYDTMVQAYVNSGGAWGGNATLARTLNQVGGGKRTNNDPQLEALVQQLDACGFAEPAAELPDHPMDL